MRICDDMNMEEIIVTGKWTVQKTENSDHTCLILAFLLEEYCRIFGFDVMLNEDCIVYNDLNAECPRFNHSQPLTIRLNQSSLTYWCQTIFGYKRIFPKTVGSYPVFAIKKDSIVDTISAMEFCFLYGKHLISPFCRSFWRF